MALQNPKIDTMGGFMNAIYYIPSYQRDYSWEQDELQDFWKDITDSLQEDYESHFFGQVVVHKDSANNNMKNIIDGQQRTTTSMIFMRALQFYYQELLKISPTLSTATKKVSEISSQAIGYYDDEEKAPHLNFNDSVSNNYFINNILLSGPSEKKQKSKACERMRKAYKFFCNNLEDDLSGCTSLTEKKDLLNDYYNSFTQKFQVLYIEATDIGEAFVIFETLNARGVALETADLLKNFIFSKSDINYAQKTWKTMIDDLDKADTTKYIRHYWISSTEFARDKELYKKISNKIQDDKHAANTLLENLATYAKYYHDLCYPEDASTFEDDNLITSVTNLKTLKAKTFYPVILAMYQVKDINTGKAKYTEKDIAQVANTIETYIFRNFTICGRVSNTGEILFAKVASQIVKENISTVEDIVAEIRKEMVDDTTFKELFAIWEGTTSSKETIRYILKKIHNATTKNKEISTNNNEVHIEHIHPVKAQSWNFTEEEHEKYLWRLGNLTLLSSKLNETIKNSVFDVKKNSYKESWIQPTIDLLAYDQWTPKEIEKRQSKMAELALKIWK